MRIYVKKVNGEKVHLEVDPRIRVHFLKKKLSISSGREQKLCYEGKELKGPTITKPLMIEDGTDNHLVVGKGEKCFQALYLNSPNSFVTFRYSSKKYIQERKMDIESSLKELISIVESKLDFKIEGESELSKYFVVRLYCGDQMVYCLDFDPEELHSKISSHPCIQQYRCFDYFSPRNEVWSVIIEAVHPGETLEYYNVKNNSSLKIFNRRVYSPIPDLDRLGIYYFASKKDRRGLFTGINIEVKCSSHDCSIKKKKKQICFYSNDVISRNSDKDNWRGESFDFDYDIFQMDYPSDQFCGCGEPLVPKKCIFKDCYWKFSAIVLDPKIRYRRIESKWELATKSLVREFDSCEFYNSHQVVRLQVQIRFYRIDRYSNKLIHPFQHHCLFCRGAFIDSSGGLGTPLCVHYYHRKCVKKYYQNSSTVRCIKCNPGKLTVLWTPDLDKKEKSEFVISQILDKNELQEGCQHIQVIFSDGILGDIPKIFLFGL